MAVISLVVAEDNNFEIFEELRPVLSPSSSTTSGSDASPALGDDCVQSFQFEMPQQTQTTRYRLKRLKNNRASRMSRLKKKEKFKMMEQRLSELEKENRELKQKLQLARIVT